MRVCTNCRRHIRESECPFCHTLQVDDESNAVPSRVTGSERLRRGALVASVLAMSSCAPVALYGIPADAVTQDSGAQDDTVNASSDAPSDVMMVNDIAVYGIPPQDAGND